MLVDLVRLDDVLDVVGAELQRDVRMLLEFKSGKLPRLVVLVDELP